jgi:hypothetical protein
MGERKPRTQKTTTTSGERKSVVHFVGAGVGELRRMVGELTAFGRETRTMLTDHKDECGRRWEALREQQQAYHTENKERFKATREHLDRQDIAIRALNGMVVKVGWAIIIGLLSIIVTIIWRIMTAHNLV